jgi:hypothetical protein
MISANLQLYTQGELLAMLKSMFTSIKALDCSNRRTQIAPWASNATYGAPFCCPRSFKQVSIWGTCPSLAAAYCPHTCMAKNYCIRHYKNMIVVTISSKQTATKCASNNLDYHHAHSTQW